MSENTKLDPQSLSAEERAIVDAFAINKHLDRIGGTWDALYSLSTQEAEGCILARRALFGIATEKMACPNCGEITGRSHSRYQGPGPDKWICQPAQPEPEKAVSEIHRPVCLNCWQTDTGHGWKVNGELRYSCASTNKPAQPEPAAPVTGSTPISEYDPDMKPAAPEMPEILSAVMDHLYQAAEEFAHYDEGDRAERCNHLRAELKHWWRTHAQPVAVGMTEELSDVLAVAAEATRREPNHPQYQRSLRSIAAVRQQAAQGQRPKLEKVRGALSWLKMQYEPGSQGYTPNATVWKITDAALAELDAAEGRK